MNENWDEEFTTQNDLLVQSRLASELQDGMELSDDDLDWDQNKNNLNSQPKLVKTTRQDKLMNIDGGMSELDQFENLNLNSEMVKVDLKDLLIEPSGKITRLGIGKISSETVDWDDDFEPVSKPLLRGLGSHGTAEISDEFDDVFSDTLSPLKLKKLAGKPESFDLDFDLPDSMSRITLSPALTQPKAIQSRTTSIVAIESGEEENDDDETFFQDITLPPYFMGGPGAMTPPSDGESILGGKIDLQEMLKRKLAARGRLEKIRENAESSDSRSNLKLDGYMEDVESPEVGFDLAGGFKIQQEKIQGRLGAGMKRDRSTTLPPAGNSRLPMSFGTRAPSVSNPNSTIMPSSSTFNSPARSNSANSSRTFTRPVVVESRLKRPAPSQVVRDRYSSNRSIPNIIATASTPPSLPRGFRAEGSTSITPTLPPSPVASPTPKSPRSIRLSPNPSTSNSASPGTNNRARVIERKSSLGNIALGRKTNLLPPSNSIAFGTTRTLSRQSSTSNFSLPTSASSSRTRNKSITSPLLISTPTSPKPLRTLKSQSSFNRIPGSPSTLSTWKDLAIPPSPINLSRPRGGKRYGDGTELDGFDDLPTNREREERISARSLKMKESKISGLKRKEDSIIERKEKRVRSEVNGKIRKQPQLIKNLGAGDFVRVQNGMTWNPLLLRWEGNEAALSKFDKIPTSSSRPALISPHLGSPIKTAKGSLPRVDKTVPKVVGGMIFDPVRMSWFSIEPSAEEELNFDMSMEDDNEQEDNWSKLESARNLKNRNSFISSSEISNDLLKDGGESDDLPRRGVFWEECRLAENRHREEMVNWIPKRVGEFDNQRENLWDIWKLVLDLD